MKIIDVLVTKSYTGFYFDDQAAIKNGASQDGLIYLGTPITPGFKSIRQPGEAISIQLVLEDGSIGIGDCAAVQYSGAGGREVLFTADEFIPFIEKNIKPLLIGEDVSQFRPLAEKYDKLVINNKPIHMAIRYGLTQALLNATAQATKLTKAEVVRREYNINDDVYTYVPIFTQSGDDRYINADKMILKEVDALPHALFNNLNKLGQNGEKLVEYIKWLKNRVVTIRRREDYNPVFHIDTYGTIGMAFNYDIPKMVEYFKVLEETANPFKLRIEGPVDAGSKEKTIYYLKELRKELDSKNIKVEIVADEWCNTLEDVIDFVNEKAGHMVQIKTPDLGGVNNTIEAILYCHGKDVTPYCGGTCNETEISAQVTTNIAIACKAVQILGKPGMGCDEALMICKNEENRVLAIANNRKNFKK